MAKEKKYPEIIPDLPYQRTWTLFYIIIWIIGLINKSDILVPPLKS